MEIDNKGNPKQLKLETKSTKQPNQPNKYNQPCKQPKKNKRKKGEKKQSSNKTQHPLPLPHLQSASRRATLPLLPPRGPAARRASWAWKAKRRRGWSQLWFRLSEGGSDGGGVGKKWKNEFLMGKKPGKTLKARKTIKSHPSFTKEHNTSKAPCPSLHTLHCPLLLVSKGEWPSASAWIQAYSQCTMLG